jgi:hypothetical protein
MTVWGVAGAQVAYTADDAHGGAVRSAIWNGFQFINCYDLGRELQTAWTYNGLGEERSRRAYQPALGKTLKNNPKKRVFLMSGPASSDLTGKACSPYGIHWTYDTYALAHGTGGAIVKQGGTSWFFITADYAFGHALERDTSEAVKAAGGTVLGAVRAPLNRPGAPAAGKTLKTTPRNVVRVHDRISCRQTSRAQTSAIVYSIVYPANQSSYDQKAKSVVSF